jgi:hypothetical protein
VHSPASLPAILKLALDPSYAKTTMNEHCVQASGNWSRTQGLVPNSFQNWNRIEIFFESNSDYRIEEIEACSSSFFQGNLNFHDFVSSSFLLSSNLCSKEVAKSQVQMLQVLFENFMLNKQDNKTANSATQEIELGEGL